MKHTPCKILIVTASIGHGHLSVAQAVFAALEKVADGAGRRIDVEIVDLQKLSPHVGAAIEKIYMRMLEHAPRAWKFLFELSSRTKWPVAILNRLASPVIRKRLNALIRMKKPRIVISTYPLWNILIRSVYAGPILTVITDSIIVHSSWLSGEPDFFAVPNEETADSMRAFGICENKINVFGYPVRDVFSSPPQYREGEASDSRRILLIASAGLSFPKLKSIVSQMSRSRLKNIRLTVVATAERFQRLFANAVFPWPTSVIGWTNELHEQMKKADLVITKAGGSTVMECIAAQKPMLIVDAIPGHEEGNVAFVEKHGFGEILGNAVEFDEAVERTLKKTPLIKEKMAKCNMREAAKRIAEFAVTLSGSSVRVSGYG